MPELVQPFKRSDNEIDLKEEGKRELARRELSRRRLLPFVERFTPDYQAGWVHKDICERLEQFSQDVMDKKSPRLMLWMPPRTGKSAIASKAFPAWYLGHNPNHEMMMCSYSGALSMGFSRQVRAILREDAYHHLFDTRLDPDSQSVEAWLTTKGGGLVSAGVGGALTGRGAHCFPIGTMVETPTGPVPIEQLQVHESILTRNTFTGRIVTSSIEATSTHESRHRLIEIRTLSGKRVRATPDHRFFVPQVGWVEARHLQAGDSVSLLTTGNALRNVSDDGFTDLGRSEEEVTYRQEAPVLLAKVSRASVKETLQNLWGTVSAGPIKECEILLRRLSPEGSASLSRCRLRQVWDRIHAQAQGSRVLFPLVCQPATLGSDGWHGKLELGARERVHDGVQKAESLCPRARRRLCGLWDERDTVSSSEEVGVTGERVFDLQVAEHHNFFANSFLVHNCLLIDDPTKGRADAESESQRQVVWDWFTSTAYTRLSPGGGICVIQCMTGDTQVTMADGSYKPLRDIRRGDRVMAWKNGRLVRRRVTNHTSQGEDDVFEIRTGNARVRANARHPFLIRSAKGKFRWKTVEEMRTMGVNSTLVHTSVLPVGDPETATLTEDEAWLLGYMYGDGWVTRRKSPRKGLVTCCARTNHGDRNERVLELFYALWGVKPKWTKFGYIRTEVQAVGQWFLDRGLAGTAKTKRLPPYLFGEPLDVRLAFLDGFASSDGGIKPEHEAQVKSRGVIRTTTVKARMTFGQSNYGLVHDLRHLARGAGYRSTNVSTYEGVAQPPNSPAPVHFTNYHCAWGMERNEEEFYYRRVRSIEPVGREEVFDIEVEDAECFVADGLVSHNTRWSDDDLSGRLIEQMNHGADQWDIVSYPAIADEDEKHRKRGEALHPERYTTKMLGAIRKTIGERDWFSLYQQKPVSDEGSYFTTGMFSRYRMSERPPLQELAVFAAWDFAIGQKEENDFTVCVVMGMDKDMRLWVLDCIRGKWDGYGIVQEILKTQRQWKPERQGMEKGQILMSIEVFLKREIEAQKAYDLFYDPISPGKNDKQARGRGIQGLMKAQQVLFPEPAATTWVDQMVFECLRFPAGIHDDVCDALAYCGYMYGSIVPVPDETEPAKPSWKDKLNHLVNVKGDGKRWQRA